MAEETLDGVPQDDTEAIAWYRLASEQTHAEAQVSVGVEIRHGLGRPARSMAASSWLSTAWLPNKVSHERREISA